MHNQPTFPLSGVSDADVLAAVGLAQIAIWRRDLDTDTVHGNAPAFAMLGLPAQAGTLSTSAMQERIHPDDLPLVHESVNAAFHSDQAADVQARFRHQDGSWRWVLTRRILQRDAAGKPQRFVGVSLDITAQKAKAQRAEEAQRSPDLITQTSGIGHWVRYADAPQVQWNQTLREIYGLSPEEPAPDAKAWLQRFVHVDDRAEVSRRYASWLSGEVHEVTATHRIVRPDGTVRHLASQARRDTSGGPRLSYGVAIDLTQQRSAELAVQNAAARAALAANATGVATWQVNLETGDAQWDARMWQLRGLPEDHQPLPGAERLAIVHPDDRQRVSEVYLTSDKQGAPADLEFRVVWPDGTVRWLASRSLEIGGGSDGPRKRIGVNWDVTDKHAAQHAQQESAAARAESVAKSQFLSRMSHELRTPLNAVLGFTQLLLANPQAHAAANAAAPGQQRYLQHIQRAGEHLLSLINDALELSNLQSGEQTVTLAAVPLADLVTQTLTAVQPLSSQRGVSLTCGALPGTAWADATRLRQVLRKLLNNAINHSPTGAAVQVQTEVVQTDDRSQAVVLRVIDHGVGMDSTQLRHLFEPFRSQPASQTPSAAPSQATVTAAPGTGMGLAVAKAWIQSMGGTVAVQSQVGQGTVFELHLKAAAAAPAMPATPSGPALATPAARSLRKQQLLYIEDNPVNALIIKELLARRPDIELHIAADGTSGVAQAQRLLPDLILIDMHLPDMHGLEVLRRLRAQPQTAGIVCIALSANAIREDVQAAKLAGMADYWTKPLNFAAFLSALDQRFGLAPRA